MSLIYQNPDGTWGVQGPPRWDTATMGPNPGSISAPSNPNAPSYSAWLFSHGTNATPEKYKQYMSEFGSGQGPSTPDPGSELYARLLQTMGYGGDKPPTPGEATQYVNKQYGLGGVPVPGSIDASGNYIAPRVEYPNGGQSGQQNQTPISSLFPSPLPSQTTTPQTESGSGFQNPYMSLPSYNLSQYPQALANSGTQFQSEPSGGTGNYAPQNYNRLPNYGFYY